MCVCVCEWTYPFVGLGSTNLHSEGRLENVDYSLWWVFFIREEGENLTVRVEPAKREN